ncbi:sigma-70 family RNA polymerase sigma factor [Bradyrhizobium sp. AUGA SZCCT0274]|uniref:sigma-70 family RNA polymerase sigma factor n=1 Tax=unclassified Bradyrhizobium TaxID=2631580 RepID=UPI001BADB5BE|nr:MULTISPECIES: sigma-70 family RNA polymerase sigma factor [unclassified Bradyrhizobium]MBR1195209.1 sigma-70 family RNA polymerase sigma factor [Bradyrhizobium sp. AUGA SZCCT0158]MBR1241703.1 sigma-70 family RNA polymerase sigma factor [Bradyrhizobium sp. AUGA SZCCT0274]
MTEISEASPAATDIDALLVALRPKLHRYCARMVGSVIDGEDVLQDALIKAVEALSATRALSSGNPEGWLFRIAHNTALDFLRRRKRQEALFSGEEAEMMADQLDAVTSRQIANASLRTFMRLNVTQRSSVILMDVLGYSLAEICAVMDVSLAAAKAALVRGRAQLRKYADEPDDAPQPKLSDADRKRLGAYVAHFNARDFDAIRAMISDDVRLDLVNKTRMTGKAEVSRYFGNYSKVSDWHLVPGLVEGQPAVLVFDPNEPNSKLKYFMLLNWSADKVATIRDFRHAPYVIDGAEYLV